LAEDSIAQSDDEQWCDDKPEPFLAGGIASGYPAYRSAHLVLIISSTTCHEKERSTTIECNIDFFPSTAVQFTKAEQLDRN
jgi:hypothetical protein